MVDIVAQWLKRMDVPLSPRNKNLYLALITEEYAELQEAETEEKQVDALVDLMWVTAGCLLHMLGEDKAVKAIQEVKRSNFSKTTESEQVAKASVEASIERGIQAAYRYTGECYIIYRVEDNKVLKPITFLEPDWSWLKS